MKFRIGLSPCPNDTFMFDAWVNKRIDLPANFSFDFYFEDIKTLNELAHNNIPDVTKLSTFTAGQLLKDYEILTSGVAIGYKNGPLIVSKRKIYPDEIPYAKIGVPGYNTTAYLLLQQFYKPQTMPKEYFFNEIEEAILENEVEAGVIIHETRFTYQLKGLQKIVDLGEQWESAYHLPLPLGVIAVKRSLPLDIKQKLNGFMYHSIEYAFQNPERSTNFIKQYAQETKDEVIWQHIKMYVNELSININDLGKKAIQKLIEEGIKIKVLPPSEQNIFIHEK